MHEKGSCSTSNSTTISEDPTGGIRLQKKIGRNEKRFQGGSDGKGKKVNISHFSKYRIKPPEGAFHSMGEKILVVK